jgi:hypothetical protein
MIGRAVLLLILVSVAIALASLNGIGHYRALQYQDVHRDRH